ncbi:hypothetical protein MIR68_011944 [Amoeboaphelidium protococcarum]|nr:hypothetical protein MIR68_011944 [Amoeboaphelidium protococcarum]
MSSQQQQQQQLTEKEQALFQEVQNKAAELKRLAAKLGELGISVMSTGKLVVNALKELEAERKCYQLLNGVLVQRRVGQVLPVLSENVDNFDRIITQMTTSYKDKNEDMLKFCRENRIQIQQ